MVESIRREIKEGKEYKNGMVAVFDGGTRKEHLSNELKRLKKWTLRTAGGSISGRGIASTDCENQPRALVVKQSDWGAHWGEKIQEHLGDTRPWEALKAIMRTSVVPQNRRLWKALSREWHHLTFIIVIFDWFLYWESMKWMGQGQGSAIIQVKLIVTWVGSEEGSSGDGESGHISVYLGSWTNRNCWQIECGVWEKSGMTPTFWPGELEVL